MLVYAASLLYQQIHLHLLSMTKWMPVSTATFLFFSNWLLHPQEPFVYDLTPLSPAFIWSSRYARYLWRADEQEISSFLLDTSTFKTSPSAQTESHTIQCAVTVSPSMFSTSTCQLMENPHSTDACPCDSFKQDLFHNTPQFQVGVTGSCHVAV